MHRSSENVAAIATALAKAQTELSNPEKAMVGTVYNARSDSSQSFRYASLSSGLDIIRKTLGGQQICEGTRCLRSLASRRTRCRQTLQVYDRFAAPQ
jgi:hypothetical protein